jgi:hypothetical protein
MKGPRRQIQLGIRAQAVVEHHHTKGVEQLPLVFVDALDLAVKDGVRIDHLPADLLEPVGELHLGFALGAKERLLEIRIRGQRFEPAQFVEIDDPALVNCLGDGTRERRVGLQQPTPGSDAIGLVVETFREKFGQVLHRDRSQQA